MLMLPIRAGFWRSNELSHTLVACEPAIACVGNQGVASAMGNYSANVSGSMSSGATTGGVRSTLSEDLCRTGHWGPMCASCLEQYFKAVTGECLRA